MQMAAGWHGSLDFQNEGLLQFQRQRGEERGKAVVCLEASFTDRDCEAKYTCT